jgi:hypothetical protein
MNSKTNADNKFKTYYQKNQERIRAKRREKYLKEKQQSSEPIGIYNEKSINILLNLKDYTNLSKQQKSFSGI